MFKHILIPIDGRELPNSTQAETIQDGALLSVAKAGVAWQTLSTPRGPLP